MIQNTDMEKSVCTYAALRRATRRMGQIYDEAVAASGLKSTQMSLLYQVRRLEQPAVRRLADELVMDISALGHTLKPLERDGLIELIPDSKDRRARRVVLSRLGEERLDQALKLWSEVHQRSEATLGPQKAAQLRETLDWLATISEFDRPD